MLSEGIRDSISGIRLKLFIISLDDKYESSLKISTSKEMVLEKYKKFVSQE